VQAIWHAWAGIKHVQDLVGETAGKRPLGLPSRRYGGMCNESQGQRIGGSGLDLSG
jgi:hypothetical protein